MKECAAHANGVTPSRPALAVADGAGAAVPCVPTDRCVHASASVHACLCTNECDIYCVCVPRSVCLPDACTHSAGTHGTAAPRRGVGLDGLVRGALISCSLSGSRRSSVASQECDKCEAAEVRATALMEPVVATRERAATAADAAAVQHG